MAESLAVIRVWETVIGVNSVIHVRCEILNERYKLRFARKFLTKPKLAGREEIDSRNGEAFE